MRECHVLLPLLEEMEKHINTFYQALERASRITSASRDPDSQAPPQQKQKWQVRYDGNYLSESDKGLFSFIYIKSYSFQHGLRAFVC